MCIYSAFTGLCLSTSSHQVATVGFGDGHDLLYRGYSISELTKNCTFEEVAYLLIRGELPSASEKQQYARKLASYRELPAAVRGVLENIPADAHPMVKSL